MEKHLKKPLKRMAISIAGVIVIFFPILLAGEISKLDGCSKHERYSEQCILFGVDLEFFLFEIMHFYSLIVLFVLLLGLIAVLVRFIWLVINVI